jgi:DNA polymerase
MNNALRREYLAALGITAWVSRTRGVIEVPGVVAAPGITDATRVLPGDVATGFTGAPRVPAADPLPVAEAPVAAAAPNAAREAPFDWPELRARVAACTRCTLSATRTQTVFGVGNPHAEWLIVGEAPGAEEDRRGEPFVGRAGQLLNSMLRAVGLAREQVYIANVLKCRPPGNRDPTSREAGECLPYLERQIALLKPKIMLAVGRIAAQNLLRTDKTLGGLRRQVHRFGESQVPLVVTYHPAYLLRTPGDKRKAWEDLQFAREVCSRV